MQRLYSETIPSKYISGKWSWDNKTDSLHFLPYSDLEGVRERYIETNGFRFLRTLNQVEEAFFRQEFIASEMSLDTDTVSINDVRDLVLYLMPKEFLTTKFLDFIHKPAVHRLLHALIIYFEYFLRLVEFVLIRRDELSGNMAQIQSEQSNEMKRIFSIYLSQYRMLVAKNYSIILKGEGDMAKFYHLNTRNNNSSTFPENSLHEQFLAVAIQIIWITMHRRAYFVIDMEMNRLFRSEHFITHRPEYLKFTSAERSLLYGRRNRICNYRVQLTPLVLELQHVADEDLPILWIGERKYRGNNIRIAKLELEYIIPDTQLHMIDVVHGILGHPKRFYDTILNLNWPALRDQNYTIKNDPYHIIRQPSLQIPNIDDKSANIIFENYEHFFKIFNIYETYSQQSLQKWLHRESRLLSFATGETQLNIYTRCERELEKRTSLVPIASQIKKKYFRRISRVRKMNSNCQDGSSIGSQCTLGRATFQISGGDHFFAR